MSKEEERQDFVCNDSGKGFHMKFTNGNIVSVQWHRHNYSNGSDEAEVAAWDRMRLPSSSSGLHQTN